MPKYYVTSGSVCRVVDRPDGRQAALDVIMDVTVDNADHYAPPKDLACLGLMTVVSEQGFTSQSVKYYPTHLLLAERGRRRRGASDPGPSQPDGEAA